jgi:VanZ family protein
MALDGTKSAYQERTAPAASDPVSDDERRGLNIIAQNDPRGDGAIGGVSDPNDGDVAAAAPIVAPAGATARTRRLCEDAGTRRGISASARRGGVRACGRARARDAVPAVRAPPAPRRASSRAPGRACCAAYARDRRRHAARARAPRRPAVAGPPGARCTRRRRPSDVVTRAQRALFAGFGAVWLGHARRAGAGAARSSAHRIGALVSASVEAAQLFSPRRMASVLDVSTNTAGAFVGALGVALAVAAARAGRPRPLAPAPLALVAVPYAAACALEVFSAFGRPDRVPGGYGGPATRLAAALAHLRAHPETGAAAFTDPLLFAPAGALAVLLWAERGGRPWRGAAASALGLGGLWAAVELVRGAAGADLAPWAVAVRALASLLGASRGGAAGRAPRRGRGAGVARARARGSRAAAPRRAAPCCSSWSWRPVRAGRLARRGRGQARAGGALVPLAPRRRALHAAQRGRRGRGVPALRAGGRVARRARRGGRGCAALWPGLRARRSRRGGAAFVAARTVDVTDALVQGAGVFLGWAVVRQAAALRAAARRAARPAHGGPPRRRPAAPRWRRAAPARRPAAPGRAGALRAPSGRSPGASSGCGSRHGVGVVERHHGARAVDVVQAVELPPTCARK